MLLNKKIKSNILAKTVDADDRKIGIEVECFIYNKDFKRIPVNQASEYSASDLLSELNKNINNNGYFSLEPGGQVEWSSPPYRDIKDLEISLLSYKRLLDKVLKKRGLRSLYIGVDPFYDPENIDLIAQKKYQLMNKNMEKKDILGKWMMRNTSSIQINYDIVDEKDLEEIMFIADCIHPVSSYLFSNSPFKLGKSTGEFNLRNHIWENTDKDRCRTLFDHKIKHPKNLLHNYIAFMYEVPGIFQLNDELEIRGTDLKLGEILKNRLKKNKLRDEDIQIALHQIFTNVRLKSLIEVRDFDCLPFKYILAPVSFFTGLIGDNSIRKRLIKKFVSWTDKERFLWNQNASSLEIDKIGPQNRKFIDWIEWVGDIAIEGLKRRDNYEIKYFVDFYNDVLKNGPLGLQKQRNFISSGLSLEKFIF